jgi:hypothetical protein
VRHKWCRKRRQEEEGFRISCRTVPPYRLQATLLAKFIALPKNRFSERCSRVTSRLQ